MRVTERDNKLVFTSFADDEHRFRIDVFDTDWNYLGCDYRYNDLRYMPYEVEGESIVVADMGFGGAERSTRLSRLEPTRVPDSLLVFRSSF
jgi:hypothetical protein